PRVLRAMKRPAAAENNLERIRRWREICPELAIRSTFIVGFPGEADDEFDQLLQFLQDAQLDRVGCFTYSAVDGARANQLPGAIPEDVKQARWEAFMETQAIISRDRLRQKIGTIQEVLVDQVDDDGAIARTRFDAPEIDGVVQIPDGQGLMPGMLIEVEIDGADDYDLTARFPD
ncbi:MAG: 30S ribosomal protein S12 methylthiotransferase RimO, partial [Xanthomonadales bacterium]|nr:30S ribosomal protein S12 methylthiotransferase RimO [Xanthomonadales bacterium]